MKKLIAALAASIALSMCTPAFAQVIGSLPFLANALSTTVVIVKGSRGTVAWLQCYNPSAAVTYVQVFDTAGTVTLGTTVPKLSIGVPTVGAIAIQMDTAFLAGIKIAATTTPTGLTAPATAINCSLGFN